MNPETLYNILKASAAELILLPQKEPQAIIVTGVNVKMPLSSLYETLGSVLSDLLVSRSLVWDRIVKGIGDNHWMMDGGGLDSSNRRRQ